MFFACGYDGCDQLGLGRSITDEDEEAEVRTFQGFFTALMPLPPVPPGENEDNSDWQAEVLTKAPVHHLGHFLDRFDFAAG